MLSGAAETKLVSPPLERDFASDSALWAWICALFTQVARRDLVFIFEVRFLGTAILLFYLIDWLIYLNSKVETFSHNELWTLKLKKAKKAGLSSAFLAYLSIFILSQGG